MFMYTIHSLIISLIFNHLSYVQYKVKNAEKKKWRFKVLLWASCADLMSHQFFLSLSKRKGKFQHHYENYGATAKDIADWLKKWVNALFPIHHLCLSVSVSFTLLFLLISLSLSLILSHSLSLSPSFSLYLISTLHSHNRHLLYHCPHLPSPLPLQDKTHFTSLLAAMRACLLSFMYMVIGFHNNSVL